MKLAPSMDHLRLTKENPNGIITVNELASHFYKNLEGNQMGIGVLSVQNTTLGKYEYSLNGNQWNEISISNENIEMKLNAEVEERRVKRKVDNKRKNKRKTKYSDGWNYEVLLLPPTVKLRYVPVNYNVSLLDSESNTKMVFLAFNYVEEMTQVEIKNISLSNCQDDCVGVGELNMSKETASFTAVSYGCDGNVQILANPKEIDRCGVCGGDGSSCVDCYNVVNGSAKFECGMCVGGTTSISEKPRDCARNLCETRNYILTVGDINICLPNATEEITFCDGSKDSEAYVNECGVCVHGNTNLTSDASKDNCSMCYGNNECEDCLRIINSKKRWSNCLQKCTSDNEHGFENCTVLDNVRPSIIDVFSRNKITIRATIGGNKLAIDKAKCKLVNTFNEEIESKKNDFTDTRIKSYFTKIRTGIWALECFFKIKQNKSSDAVIEKTLRSAQKDYIKILDSGNIELKKKMIEVIEPTQNQTLTNTVIGVTFDKNYLSNSGVIYPRIFMISPYFILLEPVNKAILKHREEGERKFYWELPFKNAPNSNKLAIALTNDAFHHARSGKSDIKSIDIDIIMDGARLMSATYSTLGYDLKLRLDRNIRITDKTKCSENFMEEQDLRKYDPYCEVKHSTIHVKLKTPLDMHTLPTINFKEENYVRNQFDSDDGPKASGEAKIIEINEGISDHLILGENQVCNDSSLHLKILTQFSAPVDYNVTFVKENVDWNKNKVLQVWDTVNKNIPDLLKEKSKITIPGNMFPSGVDIMIVSRLENSTKSESLLVRQAEENQGFIVNVIGPSKLFASKPSLYQAQAVNCGDPLTMEDTQYNWAVEEDLVKPFDASVDTTGKFLQIPPGTLKPDKKYTLLVMAKRNKQAATAMFEMETYPEQLKLHIPVRRMKVGYRSPIQFQAILPEYFTNLPLSFKYNCRTEDNGPCLVTRDKKPDRLENVLTPEETESLELNIPPLILQPGRYTMYLEVRNEEKNTNVTEDMHVEVVARDLPELFINANETVFKINDTVVIEGFVAYSTYRTPIDIWWELIPMPGQGYTDIYNVAITGMRRQQILAPVKAHAYPLVIPPPIKWPGFEPDTDYTFRLYAGIGPTAVASKDISIKIFDLPRNLDFTVTPMSGEALLTQFNFSLNGFQSKFEDFPLSATFGFEIRNESRIENSFIIKKLFNIDTKTYAETSLFSVKKGIEIIPFVIVCNTVHSCNKKTSPSLKVSNPKELDSNVILNHLETIQELFSSGNIETTTTQLEIFIHSLNTFGDEAKNISERIAAILLDEMDSIIIKIETSEAAEESCFILLKALNSLFELTDSLDTSILTKMHQLKVVLGEKVTTQVNATTETSNGDSSSPTIRKNPQLVSGKGKSRRSHQSMTNEEEEHKAMTPETVKSLISVSEKLITNDNIPENVKRIEMDRLVKEMTSYMCGLCVNLDPGQTAIVQGNITQLRVVKAILTQSSSESENRNTQNTQKKIQDNGWYYKTADLLRYRSWKCGDKSLLCSGVCIGTAEFSPPFKAPLVRAQLTAELRSKMVQTELLNPVTGALINPSENHIPITLKVDGNNDSDAFLKCSGWNGETWSTSICQNAISLRTSKAKNMDCICSQFGYAAVLGYKKSNTTNTKETICPGPFCKVIKTFNITINASYEEEVKGRENEFIKKLKTKITNMLNISQKHIQILNVRKGSIEAEIALVVHDGQRSETSNIESAALTLEKILKEGFAIEGVSQDELLIFAQDANTPTVQAIEDPNLPFVIGGIVGGVILLAIAIGILAIYFNKRKRSGKVRHFNQLQRDDTPSYLKMHYQNQLDGTLGSFEKKPQMEYYGSDVPPPFKYLEPTRKQLEDSQKRIPKHILRKHANESSSLPGSPVES